MAGSETTEEKHQQRKRWLKIHFWVYAIVNGFFVGIWLLVPGGPAADDPQVEEAGFFPGWLMLYWGVVLACHAVYVWGRRPQPLVERTGGQSGRVVRTVLFTDIVASTERASILGDEEWGRLLDFHDRVSRKVVAANGGQVVKQTGDGLLATFGTPKEAIRGAIALREELSGHDLEIRSGLHSGEIELRGRDVGGIAVHLASRVMDAAAPSEILVSRTVRDLASGSGISFTDRGSHELKGIDGTWELFAVEGTG